MLAMLLAPAREGRLGAAGREGRLGATGHDHETEDLMRDLVS